jgi:hypothetical protein
MTFAGLNYLAILIAAIAAWIAGAVWYMALASTWIAALGTTPEKMQEMRARRGGYLPFLYVFVANLIIAWVLAGTLAHFGPGQVTVGNGVVSGAFCWLGFVITTMLVNNAFAGRAMRLLLIDGGHWLVVLLLTGAIIGIMGV